MKRNFKNLFFALVLSIIFVFSACSKPASETEQEAAPTTPFNASVQGDVEGCKHIYNITDADRYLVQNGQSAYVIVCPANAEANEKLAASELVSYITLSTGVQLEIVTDEELGADITRYISVGKTAQAIIADVVPTLDNVGQKGFVMKSIGEALYVLGNTADGTFNGAYELLHQIMNFDVYGPDVTYYEKATSLKLNNYDIIDVPDIPFNVVAMNYINVYKLAQKMKFCQSGWISINGGGYHNSFYYLPPATYNNPEKTETYHPEWYSQDGKQLCYLAHGDEDSYNEMVTLITDIIKEHLIEFPDLLRVAVNGQDESTWCVCEHCAELRKTYGTDAAGVIRMLNIIEEDIYAWFETAEGAPYKRDLDIAFFAYGMTENAPVTKDAEGNYVPIDDSVKLNDNVCVFYAPINAEYNRPLSDEINEQYYDTMKKWSVMTKRMYLWTYSTNFHYYLTPYNSFSSMQDNWKVFKYFNVYHLFDQNQYNATNSTGFTILKGYLSSKLSWNVNCNINELIDDFFVKYYGDASEIMLEVFEALRTNFMYIENELEFGGGVFAKPNEKKFYSKDFLNKSLSLIDDALSKIAPIRKTDFDEYTRLSKAIMLEGIAYRYLLINLYGSEFSETDLLEMKRSFKADAEILSVSHMREGHAINVLFNEWGI